MSRGTLRLAFVGDIMIGRWVAETLRREGPAYPWGDIVPVLAQADLRLGNLECALTAHTSEWRDGGRKAFYFRADPAAVASLKIAGFDFVSLANNHAGDFGIPGLLETVETLDAAGIAHAGAGINLREATMPARLTVTGWRVSIVAFADYPASWAATPTSPGINHTRVSHDPAVLARVESAIAEARKDADVVVFTIHWGPNMAVRAPSHFRLFARWVIDAGADIFWGHSAHVAQGIETWHGRPILYDTGDFVDDYAIDPYLRNDLSAIFLVDVRRPGRARVSVVPILIENMRTNLALGTDRDWLLDRVAGLSSELGTSPLRTRRRLHVDIAAAGALSGVH